MKSNMVLACSESDDILRILDTFFLIIIPQDRVRCIVRESFDVSYVLSNVHICLQYTLKYGQPDYF